LLQEEKEFVIKETKNSRQYNIYLKERLKELEESANLEQKVKNETSFENNTSRLNKTTLSPGRSKERELNKLEIFFNTNENMLLHKIQTEEKALKEKYSKYKAMEAFKNGIFQNLYDKMKDYQFNLMNSKVSNQEVFFNIPEHDLSHRASNKIVNKILFLESI
jgi:hypothetical protein